MTPQRVKVIYDGIEKLVIELDPDPVSRGMRYLLDLISKTRGYLNEASFYMHEVLKERHDLELLLQAEEDAYQLRSSELLATDQSVKDLANIEDRTAMITVKLKPDFKKIQGLKKDIKNVSHVEKVVRHRAKELESTMSAIRLQKSLIESDIRTGALLGDSNDTSRGTGSKMSSLISTDEMSDAELSKLLDPEPNVENDPGKDVSSPQELPDAKHVGADKLEQLNRFLSDEPDLDADLEALLASV
jgi:hypothetical protein